MTEFSHKLMCELLDDFATLEHQIAVIAHAMKIPEHEARAVVVFRLLMLSARLSMSEQPNVFIRAATEARQCVEEMPKSGTIQ